MAAEDRADARGSSERSEGEGMIQGTPAYMSPEHASGLPLTAASDVFSFGLMLIEMLTGQRAISDRLPIEWILKLQTDDLAEELASQFGEHDRELLAPMLTRDPKLRPPIRKVAQSLAKQV
jgi:serine/threonine protein kinase